MADKKDIIEIPAIHIEKAIIKVVGDSPLIMHKWSEKAKREMLEKQMKKAKTKGHDAKSPVEDFIESLYWIDGKPDEHTEEGFENAIKSGKASFGFPSVAFKAAAVSGGYRSGVTKNKTSMNAAFHIQGDMVEIKGIPEMREDMVRIGMGKVADIRYRGEFKEWSALLHVTYNSGAVTIEQLCNLFNLGGFAVGVGEWRPEKSGSYGMFHVDEGMFSV